MSKNGFPKTYVSIDDETFNKGAGTDNCGYEKSSAEVDKLLSAVPSARQLELHKPEFYCFVHFGMNTFTGKEWGDGTDSPSVFNPRALDTDQWAESIAASGAGAIILTAKHHDGFCLFRSQYTDYTIAASPYKNGGGDIVCELSESCKKYGLKFGLYLSPWDRHDTRYSSDEYNDYFVNQLTELLDGRYGEIFSVWFDGANGEKNRRQTYDWNRYYEVIRRLQPNALIANCGPDVRWVGNESGLARRSEWSVVGDGEADPNKIAAASQKSVSSASALQVEHGIDDGLGSRADLFRYSTVKWYPAECDVSIRRGWFYHACERPKSLKRLTHIYHHSVGSNATLLLNVPPDKNGLVDTKDVKRLRQFGEAIRKIYQNPLKFSAFVGGNGTPLRKLDGAVSGCEFSDEEYILDLRTEKPSKISTIVLGEDISFSQRVERFSVFFEAADGSFLPVDDYTVIGWKKIITIPKKYRVEVQSVRIVIRQSRGNAKLRNFGLYQ